MSFTLGFIDDAVNLSNFYAVKEDILEDFNLQLMRGADNNLFVSDKSSKAEINISVDFVDSPNYYDLRRILLDRTVPNKLYFRQPGNITGAFLHPSTAVNKAYMAKSNSSTPVYGTPGTEFSSTEYTYINSVGGSTLQNSTHMYNYIHYTFTFDISSYLANGGNIQELSRASLFMQTPSAYRVITGNPTEKFGFIVRAYNYRTSDWLEIYRRSVTVDLPNQQCAGLRPITGFTSFPDYVEFLTNKMTFTVSTLQPRNGAGDIWLNFNYVALLLNGFMVRLGNNFNLNWRSEVTLEGRTGTFKLYEV